MRFIDSTVLQNILLPSGTDAPFDRRSTIMTQLPVFFGAGPLAAGMFTQSLLRD
jgi:hypothetical protein